MSEAEQEEQGGKYLSRPLAVRIAYDDGEVIVSEPRFHLHAVGSTLADLWNAIYHQAELLKDVRKVATDLLEGFVLYQT